MDSKEIGKILGQRYEFTATDGAIALKELDLPAGAQVLDVGTGGGYFAIFLASQGLDVLTGEPSTDTSEYAKKDWDVNAEKAGLRDKIRFEHFDASQMPYKSDSFDAVFFFGVLHHIDENVRGDVFREALRVAKKGGAVVFFEPQPKTLEMMWAEYPDHPPAANPSDYLADTNINLQKCEGSLMDIFIYQNPS